VTPRWGLETCDALKCVSEMSPLRGWKAYGVSGSVTDIAPRWGLEACDAL
jgi:hypothetical protein